MPILPTFILPKNILTALRPASNHVQSSSLLVEIAQSDPEQVFHRLDTTENGLSEAEAVAAARHNTVRTWSRRSSGTDGFGSWAGPASIRW